MFADFDFIQFGADSLIARAAFGPAECQTYAVCLTIFYTPMTVTVDSTIAVRHFSGRLALRMALFYAPFYVFGYAFGFLLRDYCEYVH